MSVSVADVNFQEYLKLRECSHTYLGYRLSKFCFGIKSSVRSVLDYIFLIFLSKLFSGCEHVMCAPSSIR